MEKAFYTEKELAERWGLEPKTLRAWRSHKDGDYPTFIKIGGAVSVNRPAKNYCIQCGIR